MEDQLTGSWEEFEAWVRRTIQGGFRWKVRPMDSLVNRQLVADLIEDQMRRDDGVFSDGNAFGKPRSTVASMM